MSLSRQTCRGKIIVPINVIQSATRTLNTVRRTLHPCSRDVKAQAYQTLVRPKLEYASVAWSPHTKTDIQRVEQVQRKAARFACKTYDRKSSATQLVQSLGWQTLETRRHIAMVSLLHKTIYGTVNISIPDSIVLSNRDPLKFVQPYARVNVFSYSFYPRAIRLWNNLPLSIRAIENSSTFSSSASPVIALLKPPPQLPCF